MRKLGKIEYATNTLLTSLADNAPYTRLRKVRRAPAFIGDGGSAGIGDGGGGCLGDGGSGI